MAEQATQQEDIAVIGMACRYPGGVNTPDLLWDLVGGGKDAVGDFPGNRDWHTEDLYDPSFVRQGGFLHDADTFDAAFFGIRPAEAIAMDPQQRVLLQTAWEAIERAGILPSSLKGSQTGVFVGVMPNEYGMPLWKWQDETAGFMGTGTSPSVASGRISYLLGLEGPALTIDTACSSSGTAIHTAVRSLRSGETDLALAGGCTVLAGPGMFVDYAKKGALSPDGRCRTFSDTANGTVWAEGAGVLVLESLSKAKRLGRRILGVIKGTAVNQDGASNGLTAPSGKAQVKVIQRALADARLAPQDIQLVEAHGTATKLGDPIEANAIQATYGQERGEEPVWIGSFKSNIGHSMAAAGVGGVIKCLMAMRSRTMPKTLHVEELNAHVDWSSSVGVLRESRPWPATHDGVRRCAVSSFGVSGTNSHVILESWEEAEETRAEQTTQPAEDTAAPHTLKLAAKTPSAVRAYAAALADELASGDAPVAAFAQACATQREDFDHRAVAIGTGRTELADALRAFAAGTEEPSVVHGEARRIRRPVFVFPGQGSQWDEMAVRLLRESDVFRLRVEECAGAFKPYLDFDLMDVLSGADQETDRDRTDVVQPLIFTMMLGLAALWRSVGVEPAAVVGHSQGEVAAACLSGALSLDAAARVVTCRSRILEERGRGGMVAVAVGPQEALSLAGEVDAQLVVAATNGPEFVILSGDDEPGIQALLDLCEDRGTYARRVPAKCASHSPVMAELEDVVLGGLDGLHTAVCDMPMFSTVEGRQIHSQDLTAKYWYRNLREQVRFAETIEEMVSHGYDAFVELSPHPVLLGPLQRILEHVGSDAPVCTTLRRDQGGYERFLTAAAEAYVQGHAIDWRVLHGARWPQRRAGVELPTYPFEGRRFWLPARPDVTAVASARTAADRSTARLMDGGHPFIDSVIETADGSVVLSGRLSIRSHPWLMDHAVEDTALLPGTAFAELMISAGRELGCEALDELLLRDPLPLPMDGTPVDVQISVRQPDTQGVRSAAVFSRPAGEAAWRHHADGLLTRPGTPEPAASVDLTAPAGAAPLDAAGLYPLLRGMGYGYGDAFQGVREGAHQGDWVRSRVVLPDSARVNHRGFAAHPALVDAALHAAVACGLLGESRAGNIAVPFLFNGVRAYDSHGADECWALARRVAPDAITLTLADDEGRVLLSVDRMVVRGLALPGARPDLGAAALYATEWTEVAGEPGDERRLCVVGGDGRLASVLRDTARGGITMATLDEAAIVLRGLPGPWQVVLPAPAVGPEDSHEEQVHGSAAWALAAIQRWLHTEDLAERVLLTFVTEGSIAVPGDDTHPLGSSAVWGVVRSAQTEHPGQFRVLDVDAAALDEPEAAAAALARTEPQLAVRGDRVLRPYLWPVATLAEASPDIGGGTVVITGGTGTIGRAVARHLVTRWNVRSLALLSRSGPDASGTGELTAELEALGATVRVVRADVSDAESVRTALARLRAERPLAGVVHAAGVLDDAVVSNMTPDQLHKVLRSKVDSALHLDAATREDELRFFTLFSSLYGVLGGPGQANYAGANTFLDQFAQWRRAQGRPANSVAWGLWDEATGMTGHLGEGDLLRLRRNGVAPFDVAEGLALFDGALADDTVALVAARLAVADASANGTVEGPFLLAELAQTLTKGGGSTPRAAAPAPAHRPSASPATATATAQSAQEVADNRLDEAADVLALLQSPDASHDQRVMGALTLVKECVAGLLGLEARRVDAQKSFYEMGFDSLTSMELRVRLGRRLDTRLGATVVFDHPTPEALAAHVVERLGGGTDSPDDDAEAAPGRAEPRGSAARRHADGIAPQGAVPGDGDDSGAAPGPAAVTESEPPLSDSAPFPLTKLQEAYLAGRAGDFELGNVSTYLYVEVDLVRFDVRAAERALNRLVRRHAMLRAVFDPEAGTQRAFGSVPRLSIPVEDLTRLADAERRQRLAEIHDELKAQTFVVSCWPLFVVRATRIDDAVTRLHVGIDVLISDGGSSALLFEEWAELYEAPDRELPEPGASYEEYVVRLREQAASEETEPSRTYWRERLESLPPAPELPLAVRLADVSEPVFTNRFMRIETPEWEQFKRNSAAAGLTASGAVLAAYCQVLAAWSKTADFTVNCLVSHRNAVPDLDMAKVVGNFSATSLLEVHVDQAAPFRDVARQIQRQLLCDMEHTAYTGLDVLRDLGRLDAGAGRARMPVVFNSTIGGAPTKAGAQAGPVGQLCRMGVRGTPVWSGVRTPQVILDHTAFEENGGLILNWDVVEDVFPAGVVDAMFAAYERLIRELCR